MKKYIWFALLMGSFINVCVANTDLSQTKCSYLNKLVGKFIYRTKSVELINHPLGYDDSFTNGKWLLIDVGDTTFTICKDTANGKRFKLNRNLWDDDNWEEVKRIWYFIKPGSYNDKDGSCLCSCIYNQKYNLKRGDHVVWNGKCGQILIFDIKHTGLSSEFMVATVAYCRGRRSIHYCTATDEVEYIGANNLTKSNKCFKHP